MTKVVTRFAPSPTGPLHIGGVRTALFNYLFAKHTGGKFILRIEDTDINRSAVEHEKDILEGLAWLGLTYENLYRQSERQDIYMQHLERLIAESYAYWAPDGVVRFKNPGRRVVFQDEVRGEIEFDTTDLGDFVIARDLYRPLFHLAVVVDDWQMGVTHVIRGEDHISNTPRQILIQEAVGAPRPVYAHIPLILAQDRSKLSKRHGAVSVNDYRREGYLPEALINFLALLGWSPGGDQEILSLDELVTKFDLKKVQKSAAVFNLEKLNWLNKEYLKKLPPDVIEREILKYVDNKKLVSIIAERISKWGDIKEMLNRGELDYFFKTPAYAKSLLKNTAHIEKIIEILQPLKENDFTAAGIKSKIWDYATEHGRGEVLWPMRVALSGREKSADPFSVAEVLGREETLKRLRHAKEL